MNVCKKDIRDKIFPHINLCEQLRVSLKYWYGFGFIYLFLYSLLSEKLSKVAG